MLSETQCILWLVSLKIYHPSRSQNDETGPCLAMGERCLPRPWLLLQCGRQCRGWRGALLAPASLTYQDCMEMGLFRTQGKSEDFSCSSLESRYPATLVAALTVCYADELKAGDTCFVMWKSLMFAAAAVVFLNVVQC